MAACLTLSALPAPKHKRKREQAAGPLLTPIPPKPTSPVSSDFLSSATIQKILEQAPSIQKPSRNPSADSFLAVRSSRTGRTSMGHRIGTSSPLRLNLVHPLVPPSPSDSDSSSLLSASPDQPSSPSTASTPPSEASNSPCPEKPESTWSFLDHPAMKNLPKWPISSPETPPSKVSTAASSSPDVIIKNEDAVEIRPSGDPLPLLSLMVVPPIASSLASYLYGHDLLNIRCLNSDFYSLLSPNVKFPARITYYETLLRKSLLCPRENLVSEPQGTACTSSGGNVGPCIFCSSIICSTCLSPEIWTTKRYRYLCPPCSTKPPLGDVDYCSCQSRLWVCRPCYQNRWLADIHYDYGLWRKDNVVTCSGCGEKKKHAEDSRIPEKLPAGTSWDSLFSSWMADTAHGQQKVEKIKTRKPGAKKERHPKDRVRLSPAPPSTTNPSSATDTSKRPAMRPVSCSWCEKMVDPRKEDYKLRPEKIARGETRGRLWMAELEQQKKKEREENANANSASSSTAASSSGQSGDIAIRMGP